MAVLEQQVTEKVNNYITSSCMSGMDYEQAREAYKVNADLFVSALRSITEQEVIDRFTDKYPEQDMFRVSELDPIKEV